MRLAIAFLVACGSSPPPAQPPKVNTCEQVADHVVSLMPVAHKIESEHLDPYRNIISKRCTEDAWNAEAQKCMLATKQLEDGNACERMLTEAQAAAFERDLEQELERTSAEKGSQPK